MLSIHQGTRLLIFASALMAVVSATWAWMAVRRIPPPELDWEKSARARLRLDSPPPPRVTTSSWAGPAAQSRGREWIFDLFTPPTIYYDGGSKKFSVIPPVLPEFRSRRALDDFGFRVVEIHREPYRLQLVGFVGSEGHALGTFENTGSSEHFLARGGHRVDELDLTIKDFALQRLRDSAGASKSGGEMAAIALVQDDLTGDELTLTSHERNEEGEWVVTLVPTNGVEEAIELCEGESIKTDTFSYRLLAVQVSPQGAEIRRTALDSGVSETRTLFVP